MFTLRQFFDTPVSHTGSLRLKICALGLYFAYVIIFATTIRSAFSRSMLHYISTGAFGASENYMNIASDRYQ